METGILWLQGRDLTNCANHARRIAKMNVFYHYSSLRIDKGLREDATLHSHG